MARRAPPKKPSERLQRAIDKRDEEAVGADQAAPPRPIEGTEDSDLLINRTSTSADEQKALNSKSFGAIDLALLEERIGISARIILEQALRVARADSGLSLKDKADIALRAITTLEGSRQEVVWRDKRLKKPPPLGLKALQKEREKAAEKLHKLAIRKKEVQIAHAEAALKEMEHNTPGEN